MNTSNQEGPLDGMTAVAVLLPVDYYAQLCVKAHRDGREPAEYLGMLVAWVMAEKEGKC